MNKVVHHRKPHLVLVLFLLLPAFFVAVKAQSPDLWPGFASELRIDSGGKAPALVATGDFNRDGITDIAVAGDNAELHVSVLAGNGDGTFQEPISQSINATGTAIAAGDVNADGKLDLVVGSTSNAIWTVKVLFGNGDGSLQPAASYPIKGLANDVMIEDFNHDDRPDVAFTENHGAEGAIASGIGILLNKGDGTFLSPTTYRGQGIPYGLKSGDFNGDDELDVVSIEGYSSNPGVIVLPGNGDGTFGTEVRFSTPVGSLIAAYDFDGDGRLDVAITNNTKAVNILLGQGDGTFRYGESHNLADSAGTGVVGDFNGDGKTDIGFTAATDGGFLDSRQLAPGTVHVMLGNGDGTFESPLTFDVGLSPGSPAIADFNGDNAPDLVIGHRTYKSFIGVLLNSVIGSEPCQKTDATTTVLTDSTGDTRWGNSSHDIQSVSISENTSASGEPLLEITLKVADLEVITPYTTWLVTFSEPFRGDGTFQLRSGQSGATSMTSGLEPESGFSQDGTIKFVVSRKKMDLVAGETITNIKAQVYRLSQVNDYDDWAPDDFNAPSPASYTLGGNNPCEPLLLTELNSNRAIALDSVTFVRDPFSFTSTTNFSSDQRTRIILFVMNIDLQPGEDASAVTVHAKDSQHATFSLPVEFVGKVPKFPGLTQVNVRFPDELANGGDYLVSVTYHDVESNKALITIKPPGS